MSGGIEETSASFEARSAPRSYPTENLDLLDWSARRDVIRLMVRRIEIDDSQVEIVFRIPPPPSGGTGGDRKLKAAQDRTGERRTHLWLVGTLPASGQGLRGAHPHASC